MSGTQERKSTTAEKDGVEVTIEDRDSPSTPTIDSRELAFGGDDVLPPPPALSEEEERKLWRKIDWHIMPMITVMYLCSFVDRSNIGES